LHIPLYASQSELIADRPVARVFLKPDASARDRERARYDLQETGEKSDFDQKKEKVDTRVRNVSPGITLTAASDQPEAQSCAAASGSSKASRTAISSPAVALGESAGSRVNCTSEELAAFLMGLKLGLVPYVGTMGAVALMKHARQGRILTKIIAAAGAGLLLTHSLQLILLCLLCKKLGIPLQYIPIVLALCTIAYGTNKYGPKFYEQLRERIKRKRAQPQKAQ